MKKGAGEVELAKGQSVTLKYRFDFFAEAVSADVAQARFKEFGQ